MEQKRKAKAERILENQAQGKTGDVDFEGLIDVGRLDPYSPQPHTFDSKEKLIVCVRKRPIFQQEEFNKQIDALSCSNPLIRVHECKLKVDGVTKYVDRNQFGFDHTFSEIDSTDSVYEHTLRPNIELVVEGGLVTSFAYGQTGSGKTYTMIGIQNLAINELWNRFLFGGKIS